jgi:hypothetical protein
MSEKGKFEEPTQSWINEPVDYSVDFTCREMSALERAHRRWGMTDEKGER